MSGGDSRDSTKKYQKTSRAATTKMSRAATTKMSRAATTHKSKKCNFGPGVGAQVRLRPLLQLDGRVPAGLRIAGEGPYTRLGYGPYTRLGYGPYPSLVYERVRAGLRLAGEGPFHSFSISRSMPTANAEDRECVKNATASTR